ncbi:hypothetical protein BDN72DRAFT_843900 [Pluteus cervinus]|uniref:Uncharacterized protein n=1 Tax=Pluteus cervinus TaxID=181527 RepID=A0ACD3AM44_9AGAR|nr:hypothetical protein BDN72DRAFT_843900 [Pluteus cervinus]
MGYQLSFLTHKRPSLSLAPDMLWHAEPHGCGIGTRSVRWAAPIFMKPTLSRQ